jgi:hypothetical protein
VRQCIGVVFAFFSVAAFAQSSAVAPAHPDWLTEYPVFRFFFKHVVQTESYADQSSAGSVDNASQRHFFKNAAGLTDAEETLVKSTAKQCDTAVAEFDKATAAMAVQWKEQTGAGPHTTAALLQLQSRATLRQQIVQGCVAALRNAMPPERFQLFYTFVWNTEGPRIRLAQPTAAGSPIVPAPGKL